MSYILLIASGLRFTGMLLKIQQEIAYALALKATYTANNSDYNLLKMLLVICKDGHFISSISGVDPGINHGDTDGQKKLPTDRRLFVFI